MRTCTFSPLPLPFNELRCPSASRSYEPPSPPEAFLVCLGLSGCGLNERVFVKVADARLREWGPSAVSLLTGVGHGGND